MIKDEIIAAKNKYIEELRAANKKLRAKIAADREYELIQTFH